MAPAGLGVCLGVHRVCCEQSVFVLPLIWNGFKATESLWMLIPHVCLFVCLCTQALYILSVD